MKSNLAILSSNKKSIDFVNKLGLVEMCNLYANCSRNIIDAEKFSQKFGFTKYYGSYEDLINDQDVDIILNFLPSGIKFEYSYLCLKKGTSSSYKLERNKKINVTRWCRLFCKA